MHDSNPLPRRTAGAALAAARAAENALYGWPPVLLPAGITAPPLPQRTDPFLNTAEPFQLEGNEP